MTIFNVISLLGGLGFFLYGMTIMGNGLEKLAGSKTESIIKKLTSSPLKGMLLGAVITALIQSSSGTTVIVIGLVNSGIMQFSQAIGIIMGANVGTTVTAQILRLSDISSDNFLLALINPHTLAPALAIVGAVLFVFLKNQKQRTIGQVMLGFGILFAGMFAMEGAVLPLSEAPWFAELFATLENPILGLLAGAFITAIMQSSAASIGILQALTATGAITWANAIPIILGQNIGTCITGLIASIGASRAAKRVAVSHVYFNVIGSFLWLGGIYAIKAIFGLPFLAMPIATKGGIANFHFLFNMITTLLFLPFSQFLVKLSEWTVPDKHSDEHPELAPLVLDARLYTSPPVAISQARKAVEQMAQIGHLNQKDAITLMLSNNEEALHLAQQREDVVDKLDISVTNYLVGMSDLELGEFENREISLLLNFVTEFERIGDYAVNVAERSGEVADKSVSFSEMAINELHTLNNAVGEVFALTIDAFAHDDLDVAAKVEPLEETIDLICDTLREKHILRLKNGQCSIEAGIIFLEVLTNFERISDHCSNVAARLLSEEADVDPHTLRRNMHHGDAREYTELAKHYREKYLEPIRSGEAETAPAGSSARVAPLLQKN